MSISLIINADDFGMSKVFNDSILDLIRKEKIKSTSFMVNHYSTNQEKQLNELITLSKKHHVSIGLHLEIEKNKPLTTQLTTQIEKFKEILGFQPTHIDIHKASSIRESIPQIERFCKSKSLPIRNHSTQAKDLKTTTTPVFNGSKHSIKEIETWISNLREGIHEILFHPGKFDPTSTSSLNKEREEDVKKILELNTQLKARNIKLANFSNIKQKTI